MITMGSAAELRHPLCHLLSELKIRVFPSDDVLRLFGARLWRPYVSLIVGDNMVVDIFTNAVAGTYGAFCPMRSISGARQVSDGARWARDSASLALARGQRYFEIFGAR